MAEKKQKNKSEVSEAEIVSDAPKSIEESIAEEFTKESSRKRSGNGKIFWGMLLIAIGTMLVLENYFEIDVWQNFWPILVILIGLSIIFESFETKEDK